MAEFSKHDMKMFDLARKAALESTYEPFKLGAVISYKGRVLATGHNSRKTNPCRKSIIANIGLLGIMESLFMIICTLKWIVC